jgi:hypothetical protein
MRLFDELAGVATRVTTSELTTKNTNRFHDLCTRRDDTLRLLSQAAVGAGAAPEYSASRWRSSERASQRTIALTVDLRVGTMLTRKEMLLTGMDRLDICWLPVVR